MDEKKIYILRRKCLARVEKEIEENKTYLTQKMINKIRTYTSNIESIQSKKLNELEKKNIRAEDRFKFIRSRKRILNSKSILQYLIGMHRGKISLSSDLEESLIYIFLELKTLARFNIETIIEDDVIEFIKTKYLRSNFLLENIDNIMEYIEISYKEIVNLIKSADYPDINNFVDLFTALKLDSIFWFTIKEGKVSQIRKSTLFIYLLTNNLLSKIEKI